jgi:hypothetical protein
LGVGVDALLVVGEFGALGGGAAAAFEFDEVDAVEVAAQDGPGVDAVQVTVEVAVGDHDEYPPRGWGVADESRGPHPGFRVGFQCQ